MLPNGWAICRLDECCEIVGGQHLGPGEYNLCGLGIPYLTGPADFGESSPCVSRWTEMPRALSTKGDVLITVKGAGVGKANLGIDAAISRQLMALRPSEALDPRFLLSWLKSVYPVLSALGQGATVPGIGKPQLAGLTMPIPPRMAQTRIVEKLEELLSDLDAGVAELKAAKKKLAQYRQSLIKAAVEGALTAEWRQQHPPAETGEQLLQRILTERRARWEAKQLAKFKDQGKTPPKDWQKKYPEPVQPDTSGLPELPQGWVWASVDELCDSVRNGLSKTPNTEQRGFPIFKINAVRPMAVNFEAIKHIEIAESEAADYWVEIGDVLATRYNGSIVNRSGFRGGSFA